MRTKTRLDKDNLFVQIGIIYSEIKEMKNYNSNDLYITNTPQIYVKEMLKAQKNFFKNKNTDKYKHRLGINIQILLPEDFKSEYLNSLFEEIENFIFVKNEKLPMYATLVKKNEAYYFHVTIFERYYYDEPKAIVKSAAKNIYKNKTTGKYCNENDIDAFLFKKKGEIVSTKYSHYSNKTTLFQFKNNKEFKSFQLSLNQIMIAFFSKNECDVLDSFFTRRINYQKFRIELQPYIKVLNSFLRKIDVAVNELEEGISINLETPLLENSAYMSLCNFIEKEVYNKLIIMFEKIDNEDAFNYQELINFASDNYEIVMDRIRTIETKLFETFD